MITGELAMLMSCFYSLHLILILCKDVNLREVPRCHLGGPDEGSMVGGALKKAHPPKAPVILAHRLIVADAHPPAPRQACSLRVAHIQHFSPLAPRLHLTAGTDSNASRLCRLGAVIWRRLHSSCGCTLLLRHTQRQWQLRCTLPRTMSHIRMRTPLRLSISFCSVHVGSWRSLSSLNLRKVCSLCA
jgi:hypothetical protein